MTRIDSGSRRDFPMRPVFGSSQSSDCSDSYTCKMLKMLWRKVFFVYLMVLLKLFCICGGHTNLSQILPTWLVHKLILQHFCGTLFFSTVTACRRWILSEVQHVTEEVSMQLSSGCWTTTPINLFWAGNVKFDGNCSPVVTGTWNAAFPWCQMFVLKCHASVFSSFNMESTVSVFSSYLFCHTCISTAFSHKL